MNIKIEHGTLAEINMAPQKVLIGNFPVFMLSMEFPGSVNRWWVVYNHPIGNI